MSPESVVDGVTSIMKSQVAAKGLELRTNSDADLPRWIVGDPTRVRQILLNLVGNALKFTQTGHITIRARPEPGREFLRFEVEDSGIGIPEDRQHLLFKDFSQVDSSTSRRYGGTGLGLSICRRLAEAMGGTIGVSSEPNRGSVFWFTIRSQETEVPEGMAKATERTELHGHSRRILVAEDMPMNQIIIEAYLRRAGHQVTLVGNGAEAVEAVRRGGHDLVLMDMEMPVMDGLGATRAIRALTDDARTIPIIALTANAMLGDLERCKAAGMNDFLSKPVDRDMLIAKISQCSGAPSQPTARTQSPSYAVLDPQALDELEKALEPAEMTAMSELFLDQLEQMAALLRNGADYAELGRAAHDLTAVAGSFGCTQLMHLSRSLMTAMRTGETSGISQLKAETASAVRLAAAAVGGRYPARTVTALRR
jgi:CheY-like chemotaxis protein